jgi:DNA-binding transcriptional LysR family regulator
MLACLCQKHNRYLFSVLESLVMELRQLEYLVAVAEEASFTRAAERVHISQSGVSAQIRKLEQELGAPLLDRSGRTATLTGAGSAMLNHARAALEAAAAVRRAVDDVTELVRGRLVVGMVTGCTITAFFEALAGLSAAHPGIEISLYEDSSDRLVEDLRTGASDLVLAGAAGAPPQDLESATCISERIVALVPAGHSLARRRRLTLPDLVGHPLVALPAGSGIHTVLEQACAAQGLRLDVAFEEVSPVTVADLAARGLGIAILSESFTDLVAPGELTPLLLDDVTTHALLALMWTRRPSPALRQLVGHCRRSFGLDDGPTSAGLPARSRKPILQS